MLTVTTGMIAYSLKIYQKPDNWDDTMETPNISNNVWISAAIIAISSVLALYCIKLPCGDANSPKKALHITFPINYILCAIFTLSFSVVICKISVAINHSNPGVVFEAYCLTVAAFLGITIYAFTGLQKQEGLKEITYLTPMLSAVGLVFGLGMVFVFGP